MIKPYYQDIKAQVIEAGFANEIEWASEIKLCNDSTEFAFEAIWVICNSGMKYKIASQIYASILTAITNNTPIETVFNHKGKVKAIKYILEFRNSLFQTFLEAEDKISYLETLPYIGKITKYHLARNLGLDVCKPDRHLERIAQHYRVTPLQLCEKLSQETGDRIGVVDIILWRASIEGIIDTQRLAQEVIEFK